MLPYSLKSRVRPLLPKQLKPHRIQSGPLRGYVIVTSWHDYPAGIMGWTERELLEWFEKNVAPGETWLDVGGHYGYTALALAKLVTSHGRVFVFEPVLQTAACLTDTARRNALHQVTVVPLGLDRGRAIEKRRLHCVRGMADSTIVNTHMVDIFVISLDALWKPLTQGAERIDGIKIDVQGMEYSAVLGMKEILKEFSPKLVIEFHKGVDRRPIIDLLVHAGYAPSGLSVENQKFEQAFEDDHSYAFTPLVSAVSSR